MLFLVKRVIINIKRFLFKDLDQEYIVTYDINYKRNQELKQLRTELNQKINQLKETNNLLLEIQIEDLTNSYNIKLENIYKNYNSEIIEKINDLYK